MESPLREKITSMMRNHKKRQVWYHVVTTLAVVVVFVTTYMLILPAITMENKARCGITEHKHDANCYSTHYESEKVLECTTEMLGVHKHTDACYDAEHKLICAYADFVIHQHDASCYDKDGTLVCTILEHKLHEHTESCYQMQKQLICTQEEYAGHVHTAECYTKEKGDLTCMQEEHTHSEECYDAEGSLICTQEEHVHDDACYQWNDVLTCTIPESVGHQHSDACYQDVQILVCEEPAEIHTHTDACYQGGVLACGKAELKEHQHSDACFKENQVLVETLVCDRVEHVHTDECYKNDKSSEGVSDEVIGNEEISGKETFNSEEAVSTENSSEEGTTEKSIGIEEVSSELESSEEIYGKETASEEVSTEECSIEETVSEEISTEELSVEETSDEEFTTEAEAEDESIEEASSEAESEEADNEDIFDVWDLSTDGVLFTAYLDDVEAVALSEDTAALYMGDSNAVLYSASTEQTGTDFKDYITSAEVQKIVNGKWQEATEFENGDDVQVALTYTLPEGAVTPNNRSIWYQLPDGVVPNADLSGIVYDKSNNPIGTYKIGTGGLIQIEFYEEFATGKEITGDIFFSGKVESDNTKEDKKIEFGGSSTGITIKKEKEEEVKTDINIKKEGEVSGSKDKITYKVTISSDLGTGEAVKLDDYLTNGTYDIGSIKVTKSGTTIEANQYTLSFDSDSETCHMKIEGLPELKAGEAYEITYDVTPSKPSANGELKVTNNATTNKNKSTSCSKTVKKTLISKSGKYNSDKNKIEWTVTLNPDGADLNGYTISDKLEGSELTGYKATLKYSDGRTAEITLPYTFTESITGEVSISYETDVDSETASGNVKNVATVEKDGDSYDADSEVGYTKRDWDLQKYLDGSEKIKGQDKMAYTWKSIITLPDAKFSGLSAFVYEDTIGESEKHSAAKAELEAKIKGEIEFEYIDENGNSKTVSGSDVNQYFSYEITYTPENSDKVSAFKITFTPKAGLNIKGKSIKLTYSTNADVSDVQQGSSAEFTNTAKVNDIEKTARVDYKKPVRIQKASSGEGVLRPSDDINIWWETGYEYRGYVNSQTEVKLSEDGYLYYRLILNLETAEDITINDLLPVGTAYVEGSAFAAYCSVSEDGTVNAIAYTEKPITIHVSAESQKDESGNDYQKLTMALGNIQKGKLDELNGYVAVYYAVKVADNAFGADGKLSLTNKATWGDESAENTTNVKHFEKIVEKTGKQVVDQQGNPVDAIEYKIVINPGASNLDLEKDTVTLVDTISYTKLYSVSLDLDAVKLYYYDAAKEDLCGDEVSSARYQVRYDSDSGKMTVILPDELACVLVYQYNYDKGDLADKNGTLDGATVSNSVKLMGESSKSDVTELKVNKSGATTYQNIEIYKVDSVNFTKKLPGAKFTLKVWKDNNWQDVGEYTSGDGENGTTLGEVELQVTHDDKEESGKIWKNYIYCLEETEAPAGYAKRSELYYFVRTNGDINQSQGYWSLDEATRQKIHRISISGGTIYIPNEASGVNVRKVWVDPDGSEISKTTGNIKVQLYKSTGTLDGVNVTVQWNGGTAQEKLLIAKGSQITIQTALAYDFKFTCDDANVEITMGADKAGKRFFIVKGVTKDCVISTNDYYLYPQFDYTAATDVIYGETTTVGEPVVLSADNDWSYEWSDLEVGDDIYYYVKEVGIHSGYAVSYMNNSGIHSGEIVITNKMEEQPVTLPETGGTGTYLYTLGGVLLIAGAALLMYINFMRKGGRRIW